MTPYEYGYWSVQWAFDIALGEIKDLVGSQHSEMLVVKKILERPFPALFQLASLYASAYWFYAWGILWETPVYVVPQIKSGTADGILNYLNRLEDVSLSAKKDMADTFYSSCQFYLEAHGKDHIEFSKRKPGIFYPDPSSAARKFFEICSKTYLDDNQLPTEAEKYFLTFIFIDAGIPRFYEAQQNEIGISFI
jgi:hypothetical protein